MIQSNNKQYEVMNDVHDEDTLLTPLSEYYKGGQWGQCLDLILHLCQFSENVLLVSGTRGMGKTKLKDAIRHEANSDFVFCELQVNNELTSDLLIEKISDGFMVNSVPASFNQHQDYADNQVWVLLVDDADQLSVDLIGTLLDLRNSSRGYLHIVLLADRTLEPAVLASAWAEEFEKHVHVIELEPLTLAEVEGLLTHEWHLAGNNINLPLSKSELKKIFSLSSGITSEVLKLANASLEGEDAPVKNNFISSITKALSPIIMGLSLLFGAIFVLISFFLPNEMQDEVVRSDVEQVIDEVKVNTDVATTSVVPVKEQVAELATVSVSTITDNVNDTLTTNVAQTTSVEQELAVVSKQQDNNIAESAKVAETAIVVEEQKIAALDTPKDSNINAAKNILNSSNAQKTALSSKNTLSLVAQNEKNILDKNPKHYTIQLLGSGSEKGIIGFINENKLSKNTHYYRTKRNGNAWYILVTGDYSSQAEAERAIQKLPVGVQSLKPFTREIDSIHKVISSNSDAKSSEQSNNR